MLDALNRAIVVVDPQVGWVNPQTEATLTHLSRMLDRYRCWSVVRVAQFVNRSESPFRSLLPWWTGFQDQADTALIAAFVRPGVPVFPHDTYGLSPEFWESLRMNRVDQLILTGVETDATIAKTAMDAFDRGLSVLVPRELVASTYGPVGQRHGLAILKKVLGRDRLLSRSATRAVLAQCGSP